ncbi:hypothetical protein [Roseomonas haemaphysalidis]|uniref:Uncharacterized protein n=1 Tax=Roseomonas haemaphysalidis TaxID=2768162 RepID=A0ABS3KWN8_9PROT|nr:hypothetical protein [Roseomonas haemaphysalidis]MBO1081859.1 hypothetical protein [Roseomonas haemaphysalidis]
MTPFYNLDPLSSASLDDYRSAQATMNRFGDDAEAKALEHVDRFYFAGDHEGISRWMNVLLAIRELRGTRSKLENIH